jgi:hypothetical protein
MRRVSDGHGENPSLAIPFSFLSDRCGKRETRNSRIDMEERR